MSENFVKNRSHEHLGGANPDINGDTFTAAGKAQPNQRGLGTQNSAGVGMTEMDESVQAFKEVPTPDSHRGNTLPPLPPFKRGVE